jgi:hypothetical protein
MGIICLIIGLVAGFRGMRFFNNAIGIAFVLWFGLNLALIGEYDTGFGDLLAHMVIQLTVSCILYGIGYGITYFIAGRKKVKTLKNEE